MGKRGSPTNAIDFSSWITADYRWAMTGTPTPQTTNSNGFGNIFGLLKFLKHDFFSAIQWGEEVSKTMSMMLIFILIAKSFSLLFFSIIPIHRDIKHSTKLLKKIIWLPSSAFNIC